MNPYAQQQAQARMYLEKQIQNATPAQQIVMLYDAAMRHCQKAKDAIAQKDIQSRHNANSKALEIVAYLMEILDHEKGGEVSARLHKIYAYIMQELLKVDIQNNAQACEEAIHHLRTLRGAWQQLATDGLPSPQQAGGQNAASTNTTSTTNTGAATPVRRSATA